MKMGEVKNTLEKTAGNYASIDLVFQLFSEA
jgi:hypothetical protein